METMKGEYGNNNDTKTEPTQNNMFSKLHHHRTHHHPHHFHHPHQFSHPFQLNPISTTHEQHPQTSEEDNTSAGTPNNTNNKQLISSSGGDGATIEVVRRPRGRPPGSKNKPKPPVIITTSSSDPPPMSPYILELPSGVDLVDSLSRFSSRKNIGLVVLTASGTVSNVTLRQPSSATVTFHGRFDILSISATFLPPTTSGSDMPNGFTISLAGPQGQIVGGIVAGGLIAAGTVYVIAASFSNPTYHRLPAAEEMEAPGKSVSGEEQSPGGGESGGHAPGQSCGMTSSMYSSSCQLASDVIWAPTARQPPPPPPY